MSESVRYNHVQSTATEQETGTEYMDHQNYKGKIVLFFSSGFLERNKVKN